jgi:hypothetical protein
MKIILTLLISFLSVIASAQNTQGKRTIEVAFHKRTTLIFPDVITDDVCGSEHLTLDHKDYKEYLTANSAAGFENTSLFIELANGTYYDLVLHFNDNTQNTVIVMTLADANGNTKVTSAQNSVLPSTVEKKEMPIVVPRPQEEKEKIVEVPGKDSKSNAKSLETSDAINASEPLSVAKLVSEKQQNVYFCEAFERSLHFTMETLFLYDNHLYLKLVVENRSNIEYQIQSIEFNIQSKGKLIAKTSGEEGQPLPDPVAVFNKDLIKVSAKGKVIRVYVFDKFTISDKKKLVVKIFENGGDRELNFSVEGKTLLKAEELKLK